MADLLGRNIGANYKGFLNTAGDANTPFGTTFIGITDGMGNDSALQLNLAQTNGFIRVNAQTSYTSGVYLSVNNAVIGDFRADATNGFAMVAQGSYPISFYTNNTSVLAGRFTAAGNLAIGHTTATARLHVRGDGTNPLLRLEESSGTTVFQFSNTGILQFGQFGAFVNIYPSAANDLTTPTIAGSAMVFRSNVGSSSANSYSYFFRSTNGAGTIQSTSGTNGFMNLTGAGFSAAAGSGNYRHLDIGYTINNSGLQTGTAAGIFLNATETALNGMGHNLMDLGTGGASYVSRFIVSRTGGISLNNSNVTFTANANGVLALFDNTFLSFNRLCFGGTSSSFPALARQGITSNFVICSADQSANTSLGVGMTSTTVLNTSAVLQIDSTTKGFLPPRMTTAEITNIGTPADGLVVYNTTIGHLCVRAAGVWHKLSQSTM
jgi:hypothetical protein